MANRRNTYRCAVEVNQTGKYCVRIQANFRRSGWTLSVYYLASSPVAALRRLREAIDGLQHAEERLRFWAIERSGDPELLAELLGEMGLAHDRRNEFPASAVTITVAPEQPVRAAAIATLKRELAPRFTPLVAA